MNNNANIDVVNVEYQTMMHQVEYEINDEMMNHVDWVGNNRFRQTYSTKEKKLFFFYSINQKKSFSLESLMNIDLHLFIF